MYSQTKSYVSIAIGLLEEEGKLNLDDTVASYFPEKID
jgi:CubicO group peptidase (beta-lactamase class C family)